MNRLKPKDVIAAVTIISVMILKYKGLDGQLDLILALIVGYYFGHRQSKVDNGL